MAHTANIFRERRINRRFEKRLQPLFEQAKEQAIKQIENEMDALFADGAETHTFRIRQDTRIYSTDFWDHSPVQTVAFSKVPFDISGNGLGIATLNKAQAIAFAKHCAGWNHEWESSIAYKRMMQSNQGCWVDTLEYEQPFPVWFSPTNGTEHTYRMNEGTWRATDYWSF